MSNKINTIFLFQFAILLILLSFSQIVQAQSEDEAAIIKQAKQQSIAWNNLDAAAYATLFTEDCDVVNVPGWWWKGRDVLQSKLEAAYKFVFKDSKLTFTEVKVRFLSPEIAVAHAKWTMTGAKTPPGVPTPEKGIQTLVFVKQKNVGSENPTWLISAFQNTLSLPEREFPTAPVKMK